MYSVLNISSLSYCRGLGRVLLTALACGASVAEAQNERTADLMQNDPNGGVLTLTAVSVVFAALILLAVIFTMIGRLMQGSKKSHQGQGNQSQPVAEYSQSSAPAPSRPLSEEALVAISLALEAETSRPTDEVALAIALSLESHLSSRHDLESYVLTLNPRRQTAWNARQQGMRQEVQRLYSF